MNINYVGLIVQIILLTIVIFGIFFKAYAGEKGKNQATKEDIGEITKVVESIKTELSESIELYKNNLNYKAEHHTSLRSYERDAIFELDSKISSLISYLMAVDLSEISFERFNELEIVDLEYEKYYFDFNQADNRLDFFIEDDEFHNLKIKFLEAIFKIKQLY